MLVDKFLYGEVEDPKRLKELKVRIPIHYHMRLHGLKILGERSISETVLRALELYFQRLSEQEGSGAAAAASETAPAATGPEQA